MTSACVIGAQWANTTIYITEVSDGESSDGGITQNIATPEMRSAVPAWSSPSISFSKAWAESLNPITSVQHRTVSDNALRALPVTDEICPPGGAYPEASPQWQPLWTRPFMHEAFLTSLVANGLSHAAGATQL
jgi:hypothetical protein